MISKIGVTGPRFAAATCNGCRDQMFGIQLSIGRRSGGYGLPPQNRRVLLLNRFAVKDSMSVCLATAIVNHINLHSRFVYVVCRPKKGPRLPGSTRAGRRHKED